MSFVNSNYSSKLSPTMTENWLVQIFKNNNSSILTTNTPDLTFSFSATTYNNITYYPAILNKPGISYSLDLKGFTTKTGNISLNVANINLDGTTLLELLGNEYINGHVNVLSQIDNDNTANNALQIFSGKISSFGYRRNTIVLNVISNRPFQNVSIPPDKTSSDDEQHNNKYMPVIYGDYEATSLTSFGQVFPCPFLKNNGADFLYIVPNNATGSDKPEFYDRSLKKFLPLVDTKFTLLNEALDNSETAIDVDDGSIFAIGNRVQVDNEQMDITNISTNTLTVSRAANSTTAVIHTDNTPIYLVKDGATVLAIPKAMKRQGNLAPDDIPSGEVSFLESAAKTAGEYVNIKDGSTSTSVTIADSSEFSNGIGGFYIKVVMPQVTGKISALKITIDGDITQSHTDLAGTDGLRIVLQDKISSPVADAYVLGGSSSYNRDSSVDLTATCTDINVQSFITEGGTNGFPNDMFLFFEFNADSGAAATYNSFSAVIEEVKFEVTLENDFSNEPVASTSFNAGINKVYLGRDVKAPSFTEHTSATTIGDLNNPVAIHRELLHRIINTTDFTGDTDIENSGFKTVAELRDSTLTSPTSTHWKSRLIVDDQESLESVMKKLQYEGCFFFEFSPQAQQTAISGVAGLRYFTIADSVTANVDLSQNDISGYELGITDAQSLETRVLVNYKKHPAKNEYIKQDTYTASTHTTIFGDADIQKQEINLDILYDAIADVVGSRNSSWINFRDSLFGEYKTTVNATLVNPAKYGMLQVGDYIDFGEITFEELGSPFDEISDTFDDFVAMPTRLFKDAWSGKKFIITNLKRQVGKVSVQCREV